MLGSLRRSYRVNAKTIIFRHGICLPLGGIDVE